MINEVLLMLEVMIATLAIGAGAGLILATACVGVPYLIYVVIKAACWAVCKVCSDEEARDYYNRSGLWLAILICLVGPGCTYVKAEVEHVSHPLAGYPVGPASQEDTLNQALACLGRKDRHSRSSWFIEHCLGYKLDDGGFFGPELTYAGRFGVEFDIGRRN